MIKLLRLFLLVAFLFAGSPPSHKLVIDKSGKLLVVEIPVMPKVENVAVPSIAAVVDVNCNGPPANS